MRCFTHQLQSRSLRCARPSLSLSLPAPSRNRMHREIPHHISEHIEHHVQDEERKEEVIIKCPPTQERNLKPPRGHYHQQHRRRPPLSSRHLLTKHDCVPVHLHDFVERHLSDLRRRFTTSSDFQGRRKATTTTTTLESVPDFHFPQEYTRLLPLTHARQRRRDKRRPSRRLLLTTIVNPSLLREFPEEKPWSSHTPAWTYMLNQLKMDESVENGNAETRTRMYICIYIYPGISSSICYVHER